jgi:hypothetical protein
MSVAVMSQVWDTTLPKPLKFLLLAMADHANPLGAGIWPGVRLLAEKTSDSERNVRRLLSKLEELELIHSVAYRTGGHGKATHWVINLEALAGYLPKP